MYTCDKYSITFSVPDVESDVQKDEKITSTLPDGNTAPSLGIRHSDSRDNQTTDDIDSDHGSPTPTGDSPHCSTLTSTNKIGKPSSPPGKLCSPTSFITKSDLFGVDEYLSAQSSASVHIPTQDSLELLFCTESSSRTSTIKELSPIWSNSDPDWSQQARTPTGVPHEPLMDNSASVSSSSSAVMAVSPPLGRAAKSDQTRVSTASECMPPVLEELLPGAQEAKNLLYHAEDGKLFMCKCFSFQKPNKNVVLYPMSDNALLEF